MRISLSKWTWRGIIALLVLSLLPTGALIAPMPAAAQSNPRVGISCTTGGPNPTFTLSADDGHIILGDGNTMYMWGYTIAGQAFQHPSPVLCVNEGDIVTIVLQNGLYEPVSIMFPGQENVLANGVAAQPEFDVNGAVTSMTDTAPPNGSMTYSFVASNPGTYIYESGTNPEKQVRMGLFGVLIVRPSTVPAGGQSSNPAHYVYDDASTQFTPEEEFLALLSEIDPYQHMAEEQRKPYDLTQYHPTYWLINGRTFPDSIADNFATWLPNQPYGALARIHPFDTANHPFPGVERFVNVGSEDYPFHPHANSGAVIARDGRLLQGDGGQDQSMEKFSINIGPGQTWDVLFKWYDAENYNDATNPVPVTEPDIANLTFGMFYSGSPYLGAQGPLPPGSSTLNQCGEYYIISHNHALFQLDAWGMTMAGQITYLRVDPPLPNSCPQ